MRISWSDVDHQLLSDITIAENRILSGNTRPDRLKGNLGYIRAACLNGLSWPLYAGHSMLQMQRNPFATHG